MSKSRPRKKKKPGVKAPEKAPVKKIALWQRLALIGAGLCLLAGFEIVLRLLPVGDESPAAGDPFVGFSELHPLFTPYRAADGTLRMRTAPAKRQWFNSQDFAAEKAQGTFRIITLGGSTSYGRPFGHATSFSGWLEKLLNRRAGALERFEVINAGGISYASYRVVTLLKELLAFEPDLITVYTGHNEFLETRTYEDFLSQPQWVFRMRELLSRLETYRLLGSAWQGVRDNLFSSSSGLNSGSRARANVLSPEVETILDRSVGLESYQRDTLFTRGVCEHFRYNVARIIRLCRQAGVQVVFLGPVDNLKDFSPFKSQCRPDLGSDERMYLFRLIDEGAALTGEGRFREAIARLREAVALDRLFADSHFYLGRALLEAGDTAAARNSFLQARELDVCPLRATEAIHRILEEETTGAGVDLLDLQAMFGQRSPGGIIGRELLTDHIHPLPENNLLIAVQLIAWMSEKRMLPEGLLPKEEDLSAVYMEVINSLDIDYFRRGVVNLAKVFTWSKKYREVYYLLENQWEMLSGDGQAQYMMGFALKQLGAPERAQGHLIRALELLPGHRMALTTLAGTYSTLGKTDSAAITYEKALGRYPEDIPLLSDYAILSSRAERYQKALELFRRALRLDPYSPGLNNNIGITYMMLKQYTKAAEAFQRALSSAPDDPQAYHNLGVVSTLLNQNGEAEEYFLEAIRRNPDHASARTNLGTIYQKTGRTGQAVEQYRLALVINPNSLESYINLTKLYQESGRDSLAMSVASDGLQRFPDNPALLKLTGETGPR
ncbi:MAG: tetratricopeptide repeat protein [Gemmatimonadota bacterium]|nr:tetratricopeptide repeat protein [Gemmatimonadota bacterium]